MMTTEQKHLLQGMAFRQLTVVLLDLYYRLPCAEVGVTAQAKAMGITADMVSSELNWRIYHTEA